MKRTAALTLLLGPAFLLAGAAFALFAPEADAGFIAHDPMAYRHFARQGWHLVPSGLLSDLLARGLAPLLESGGVPFAYVRAYRLVACLGFAMGLVILLWPRGRSHSLSAWLLVLPAALSWGALTTAAVGEIVPLGTAAALLVLRLLTRDSVPVRGLAAAFVLATIARQDNVLLAPLVLGAWWRSEGARRASLRLGVCGLASIGIYAVAWIFGGGGKSFLLWLLTLATQRGQFGSYAPDLAPAERFAALLRSGADALAGPAAGGEWVVIAPVAALLPVLAAAVASRSAPRGLLLAYGGAAGLFLTFYAWFEPGNHERWHPVFFLSAGAATSLWPAAPARRAYALAGVGVAIALLALLAQWPVHRAWSERSVVAAAAQARAFMAEHPGTRLACFVGVGAPAYVFEEVRTEAPVFLPLTDRFMEPLVALGRARPLLLFVHHPPAPGHEEAARLRELVRRHLGGLARTPGVIAGRDEEGRLLFLALPAL